MREVQRTHWIGTLIEQCGPGPSSRCDHISWFLLPELANSLLTFCDRSEAGFEPETLRTRVKWSNPSTIPTPKSSLRCGASLPSLGCFYCPCCLELKKFFSNSISCFINVFKILLYFRHANYPSRETNTEDAQGVGCKFKQKFTLSGQLVRYCLHIF